MFCPLFFEIIVYYFLLLHFSCKCSTRHATFHSIHKHMPQITISLRCLHHLFILATSCGGLNSRNDHPAQPFISSFCKAVPCGAPGGHRGKLSPPPQRSGGALTASSTLTARSCPWWRTRCAGTPGVGGHPPPLLGGGVSSRSVSALVAEIIFFKFW